MFLAAYIHGIVNHFYWDFNKTQPCCLKALYGLNNILESGVLQ
jgi:hypothetical protein